MKKVMPYIAMAAALCAAQAASALTNDFLIKASSCVSTTPGNLGIHGQWGISNSSAAPLTVTCPLPLPNKNYLSASMQVRGYSRNSPADPLSCTLLSTDGNGNFPSPPAVANVPFHQTAPLVGGAWLNPVVNNGFISLSCRIPGTGAYGPSYLTSIYVAANY
jgi:hypothetical protein